MPRRGGSAQSKFGVRFSVTAATPSCTSVPANPSISSATDASNDGPAIRSQLFNESLVQRIACWLPAANVLATSKALSMTSSSSTAIETSPIRSASSP